MKGFDDRLRTESIGARLIDALIRQRGNIPYYPDADAPHPFDRLIATPDKRRLCIVEIKTKCRREAYADTGINRRHFDDYMHVTTKYNLPLFLAFVDAKVGTIYGNYWTELIKTRLPGESWSGACESYPWEQRGIVYFPLAAMRTLHVLTDDERAELLQVRQTNWRDDRLPLQAGKRST